MEEYFGLQDPLTNGVFVPDGDDKQYINPSAANLPSLSDYLRSLRELNLPSDTQDDTQSEEFDYGLMQMTLPQLLELEGIKVRVTSGYRPGAKTKSGHRSHHSEGDKNNPGAYDIVPVDGNFDNLKQLMYSNSRVRLWLIMHKWGILEETTPDVMSKTGATGKHFHIGPDLWAVRMSSQYLNYNSAPQQASSYSVKSDGKMGSKAFPVGGGRKTIDPRGNYTLFHTFGYGTDKKTKYSGVDCSKKVINTLIGYMNKGCRTLRDLIMMYHLGMRGTWELAKQDIRRKGGMRDLGSGRWISAEEWIKMQETYQKHCSDYMHMSLDTPVSRSRSFLYPLVTFISRQELQTNSEAATAIALQEMRIS